MEEKKTGVRRVLRKLARTLCFLKQNSEEKIAAWETKSSLSTTDGPHAFRQWVSGWGKSGGGVEASEEAVPIRRYPGESVGDASCRKEKDKDF